MPQRHHRTPSTPLPQLSPGEADGQLVCGMAEAYAKALEHNLLLNILSEGQGGVGGGNGFRYRETPGYEVLPVARVKTGVGTGGGEAAPAGAE